jgi:hypothetical protein
MLIEFPLSEIVQTCASAFADMCRLKRTAIANGPSFDLAKKWELARHTLRLNLGLLKDELRAQEMHMDSFDTGCFDRIFADSLACPGVPVPAKKVEEDGQKESREKPVLRPPKYGFVRDAVIEMHGTIRPDEPATIYKTIIDNMEKEGERFFANVKKATRNQTAREGRMSVPTKKTKSVTIIPGGFRYKNKNFSLTAGRLFDMLRALVESPHERLTSRELLEALKVDNESVTYPEQIIKDTAKKLRRALRQAVRKVGLKCADPLPHIGKGQNLAYELAMP